MKTGFYFASRPQIHGIVEPIGRISSKAVDPIGFGCLAHQLFIGRCVAIPFFILS